MKAFRKTGYRAVARLLAVSLFLFAGTVGLYAQVMIPDRPMLEPVPLKDVTFEDFFWYPRMKQNYQVTLPAIFKHCEEKGRFHNFALAAGLVKGEQCGDFPFDDTDVYKAVEAASYVLTMKYDAGLDAYVDSIVALVAGAQEPDGYLCTCVTNRCDRLSPWWGSRRWEKINSHELYNCGHLYEAAVAHYQATGKRSLLDVACKNADLVCKVFGPAPGQIHRPGGHPIVEWALCKLYRATGKREYLDQARYFIEETGRGTDGHELSAYSQDHKPILQQDEPVGHAVRAGYLYAGVTEWARLTGNRDYLEASVRVWNELVNTKLYITGGIGSQADGEGFGAPYDLPARTAYCETCAAIALAGWSHQLFLATGQSRYIDVMERALYNAMLAGVSETGDSFFYDNPLASDGEHSRQPWFDCACCPANYSRTLASVPSLAYAVRGRDVYVNLYVSGVVDIHTDSLRLRLQQQNSMPNAAAMGLVMLPDSVAACTLRLRIPSWTTDTLIGGSTLYQMMPVRKRRYKVLVNGLPAHPAVEDGYLVLHRTWKKGDIVKIEWPTTIRRITANPAVKDATGKMAIQRGPLVYCFESVDQPDSLLAGKYLVAGNPIGVTFRQRKPVGYMYLYGELQKLAPEGEQQMHFRAIPYYAWNNRGVGGMRVWMPVSAESAARDSLEATK